MSKISGSILLRTSSDLHQRLIQSAKARDISLNELCSRRLATPSPLDENSYSPLRAVIRCADGLFQDELCGAVLYGSRARGEATTQSDWDVLIVLSAGVPLSRSLYRRFDRLAPPGTERVEVHFAHLPDTTSEATGFWSEIALDGIVLCERDLLVSRHLGRVRREIAAGVIVRRMAHGQGYWVHREVA